MHLNKSLFLLFFFTICSFAGMTQTVTLSIVQNEKAPAVALEMSRIIEDQMFGNFFDSGLIASNSNIRFDGSQFGQKNFGIKEAAFGLSDYLIAVYLQYNPEEKKDDMLKLTYANLDSVSWRVVRVLSSEIVDEKTINVSKIKVTDSDPYKQVRTVADEISNGALSLLQKQGEKK
jgi:hypothetical protein